MKIAITSQNRRTVTGHPGKCRRFWIYTVQGKQIKERLLVEIAQEEMFHHHQDNQPHPLDSVKVLISAMMAEWLRERLEKKGIKAVSTTETDPDTAVMGWLDGTLPLGPIHAGHFRPKVLPPSGRPVAGISIHSVKPPARE